MFIHFIFVAREEVYFGNRIIGEFFVAYIFYVVEQMFCFRILPLSFTVVRMSLTIYIFFIRGGSARIGFLFYVYNIRKGRGTCFFSIMLEGTEIYLKVKEVAGKSKHNANHANAWSLHPAMMYWFLAYF